MGGLIKSLIREILVIFRFPPENNHIETSAFSCVGGTLYYWPFGCGGNVVLARNIEAA